MIKKPTKRQIDFLAFTYYYTRIHGRAPAEHEIADFFKLSPPSVHQMILTLEKHGFISRVPGQARSVKIILTDDELREVKRIADF
jgi:DNA-binding MarR family transcriptional regulator